jgi:hypothetical protein
MLPFNQSLIVLQTGANRQRPETYDSADVWYLASRDNMSIYTDCAYLDIGLPYRPTAPGMATLMDYFPVVERDRAIPHHRSIDIHLQTDLGLSRFGGYRCWALVRWQHLGL